MKISILSQFMQIALSWFLGLASGFLYDAFKVLRRESSAKALSAFLDTLFCLIVCFGLFVAGMSVGDGSLGLAMLAFAFVGFCSYMFLLSDRVFAFLHCIFCKLKSGIAKISLPLRKKLKCFSSKTRDELKTMRQSIKRKQKTERKTDGTEKREHNSGYCNYGDDSLWHIQPD